MTALRGAAGRARGVVAVVALTTLCALGVGACDPGRDDATAGTATGAETTAPPTELPTTPMSEQDAAEIAGQVAEISTQAAAQVPAVLAGVWDPGRGYWTGTFGSADLATGAPPSVDDTVRIGSITKTFVATVVLQLVAEDALSLDDTVAAAAPGVAERFPAVADRTIRQLLSMRSGLPDFEEPITSRIGATPSLMSRAWTADELVQQALDSGTVGPADQTPAVYSNTNYVVLGEVLEERTGTSVADLVTTRLLEPLGLTHTGYPPADDTGLPAPATHGYVMDEDVGALTAGGGTVAPGTDVSGWTASWGGAAGIMSSSVTDLARWAAADFGSATLPADLRSERLAGVALDQGGQYGLGLQELGPWIGHLGGIPGWSTLALRNTDSGVVVVVAATACCGDVSGLLPLAVAGQLFPDVLDLG